MTSIKLMLTGAQAWASVNGPLTSGMVGIPVTIEYDEAWDGLTKNLMCRCSPWGSDDGEIRTILNVGGNAAVAHEVMQPDMYLYLGVEGFRDDGKLVIPTTWARCGKIERGANTCDDPSTDPKLSVWNQLQTEMEQTKKYVLTPEQAANIQAYAQEARQAAEEAKQAVESGLYYTPTVSQPTGNTLKFEFKPSVTGAPIPKPVTVELPVHEDPGQNGDLGTLTLGKHTDGLIYIFLGGKPMGNGLDISGGSIVEAVYGGVLTDTAMLSVVKGQTVQFGIKLDAEPTQNQTVTVSSESEFLSFDRNALEFTPDNWNVFQFVSVTAGDVTEDTNVTIVLGNSDPMLTDTSIFVMLTADGYSVDTTIPDGAYTVTAADFASATVHQTDHVQLGAYTGSHDNVYIPDAIDVNGVSCTPIIKKESFNGNTSIKYVQIAPKVNFGQYGAKGYAFDSMFMGCTSLIGVRIEGDRFTSMANAFKNCASLIFADGIEKQSACTDAASLFENCTSLEYVQDLSGLSGINVAANVNKGLFSMFKGCTKLIKVYGMPDEIITSTAVNIFSGASKLEYAKIPNGVTQLGYAFYNCASLKRVDIYADDLDTTNGITNTTFSGCNGVVVYCNAGTTTYDSLMAQYGSSTKVEIRTFGSETAMPSIVVWGDSISSPNKPWIEWPARLQERIGTSEYLIKNEALAGEHSPSTASRQGGNAITVDAFTIPADTTATPVVLNTADGKVYSNSPLFSCGGSFNPCVINGVEGVISRSGSTYNFTRLASGEAVSVASGTVVTSRKDDDFNNADNVMIFYLNGNAGWDDDADVLLNLFQLAVNHFTAKGGTKYIVIGPAANVILTMTQVKAEVLRFEELAATAFGNHWLNLRLYEIENGLEQNGLTASALDIDRMEKGLVPASLVGGGTTTDVMMFDGVNNTDQNHPNAYGANTIMLGVYEKGKALGYWD